MDERFSSQYHLDFRTGQPSAIGGRGNTAGQRAACTAINRVRARGILEAAQFSPPGEPFSPDVWTAALARRSREWELPLISLEKLGVFHDEDGLRSSGADLIALQSGAEACPYYDPEADAVYKLFDLRPNGSLGKKVSLELNDEPTIIDALVGAVTPLALKKLRWLRNACEDARNLRLAIPIVRRAGIEDVDDDEF